MSTLRTNNLQTLDSSFQIAVADLANSLDLSNSVDVSKGAAVIGRAAQVVGTYSELRTLKKTSASKFARLDGAFSVGDGGEGDYLLDSLDTTSAEKIPDVIVATDGGRWKLVPKPTVDLSQLGADKSGLTNSSVAIQKALDRGNGVTVRDGTYRLSSTVSSDYTGVDYPGTSFPSKRVDFLGTSIANTMFELDAGLAVGFKFTGDNPVSGGQGIHGLDRVGNFSVYSQGRPYPTGQTGIGLAIINKSFTRLENYSAEYLNVGLELDGTLSSMFENVYLRHGVIGLTANATAASLPNANTFVKLVSSGNSQAGVIFNTMGAGNLFIGGSIENNGTHAVPGNGGMAVNLSGANGTACLSMDTTYFEGNGGDWDLKIDNISALPVTVHLKGCVFNRVSNTHFATSNIVVTSTGGGKVKLVLDACSFLSTGTYVPSGTRPFIQVGAACEVIGWDTCTSSETTSIPGIFNSASSAILSGHVLGSGAVSNAPVGTVVSKVSLGVYDVTRNGGWSSTTTGYNVFVQPDSPTSETKTAFVTKTSSTNFRVAFRNSLSDPTYTDTDFMFMVCRVQ